MLPTWITALGGAIAALSAFIFGIIQITSDDSEAKTADVREAISTTSTSTSTSTSTTAGSDSTTTALSPTTVVLVAPPSLIPVSDGAIEFRAPSVWAVERSYTVDGHYKESPEVVEHILVAGTDMRVDDGWFDEGGMLAAVSFDLLDVVGVTVDAETELDVAPIRSWLAAEFDWRINCDPSFAEILYHENGYQGLLRRWEGCGDHANATLIDGLLVDDAGTHTVFIQLRPDQFDGDESIDAVIGSLDVNLAALRRELGDDVESSPVITS